MWGEGERVEFEPSSELVGDHLVIFISDQYFLGDHADRVSLLLEGERRVVRWDMMWMGFLFTKRQCCVNIM